MVRIRVRLFLILLIISVMGIGKSNATVTGASLTPGPIAFPTGFMVSVKTYGAVGDGVTDDTAAIQSALSAGRTSATEDYFGLPKALYFPKGVYLVRNTLQWLGCCVTLQGDGSSTSIIRLAPDSSGFNNPAVPKPLIITPAGNESFHQNIWDLELEIGAGNPGATALNYVSNNVGSVRDVLIHSDDSLGVAGIDLTRCWAGPLLMSNVRVDGFSIGISLANAEYGSTFEGITLSGQKTVGIQDVHQPIEIDGLMSTNGVPALTNNGGTVVLMNAALTGGAAANFAVQTNGTTYLRNVASTGYEATLDNISGKTPVLTKGSITEDLVGTAVTLTGSLTSGSLKLTEEATPTYNDTNLSDWAEFIPRWYGDTAGLQDLLNGGKSTIYFPFAAYFSKNEAAVTVPDTVQRIEGFSSIVNIDAAGLNGGGIRLIVSSNSTKPLIISHFGYGMKIDHIGSRPVVMEDGKYTYTSVPGAGNVFMEDVQTVEPLTFLQGQSVWARQLDDEMSGTKITNQGTLWILGLKTENIGTVINSEEGAKTELLGGLVYPAHSVPSTNVGFTSTDAEVSYIYSQSVYCATCGYATQVSQSGTTKTITSAQKTTYKMPLFIGFP